MFEIAGIFALIAIACAIFLVVSIVGLVLKLAFKIVLIPLALIGWMLKGILLLVVFAVGLAIAPVALLVLGLLVAVGIPVLILAGIVSLVGLLGAGFSWVFA